MGTISFQVVGDASVGTRTKTYTVSNENINRLVAWARAEDPTLTVAQALLVWADSLMHLTRTQVLNHERGALTVPPFDAD